MLSLTQQWSKSLFLKTNNHIRVASTEILEGLILGALNFLKLKRPTLKT